MGTAPKKASVRNKGGDAAGTVKRPSRARAKAPAIDPLLAELAANRVAIEGVSPEIDAGRFPAKAVAGDSFIVEADIFCDGHDSIDAALLLRRADASDWRGW